MNYNICPECKTPNEPEYQYCKNCGAPVQRHGGTSAGAAILGVLAVSVASGMISNMIQLAVNLIRS